MLWRVVRVDFTERCACVFGSKTHYIDPTHLMWTQP